MIARMRNRAALRRARQRQEHRAYMITIVGSLAYLSGARAAIAEADNAAEKILRTLSAIDRRLAR